MLFEYEPQTHWFWGRQIHDPYLRRKNLTFKTKKPRSWYEVGDLILYTSMDERRLVRFFPELKPPQGEEESVLKALALGLLLGPPDEYQVAYKIARISPSEDGKGTIELVPTIVLDDKTFVELESRRTRSQLELSEWWTIHSVTAPLLAIMRPLAIIYYEAALAVATGFVGSVARAGARRAALFTLRQAMRVSATRILARKIVVGLAKDSGKATVAAATSFSKTFASTYRIEAQKQRIADRSKGAEVNRRAFDVALTKAAGAAVASFVSTLLDLPLSRMLKSSGYGEVEKELSKRIIKAFGTKVPATFVKAIADAWAAELQRPGAFDEAFGKAMQSELKARFKSLVEIDFKSICKSVAE